MKMVSIMWHSHMNMFVKAGRNLTDVLELTAYSSKKLEEEPERIDTALSEAAEADVIFLYRSADTFWDSIENHFRELGKRIPVVCCGYDPSYWTLSTVAPEVVARVYAYIVMNGEENMTNMIRYVLREAGGLNIEAAEPKPVPWEGLYHPEAPDIFESVSDYIRWYSAYLGTGEMTNPEKTVGILFGRHYWVNENLEVETALIRELEALGFGVIPVFSNSIKDVERGNKGSGEVVQETFLDEDATARISAMIKLQSFFLGSSRDRDAGDQEVAKDGVEIMKKLNVPVFAPITSYHRTIEQWETDKDGIGTSIAWSIALPEFEGVIEPFIVGGASNEDSGGDLQRRMPIKERCRRVARRIAEWIELRNKPVRERKIGFILHNNPCASVEGTVGGGSQLDTLESVARVLYRMKEVGYEVTPPGDGKALIDTIMARKAISEFRWTTVDEIVKKGGVLKQVTKEEYEEWFNTLAPEVRDRMNKAWGRPPGEEVDGVPPAMVYNGKILVTGVTYGNAAVCVQPKRGCAGPRCDGQVCKILHDPDIPPPHQYMATYRYLERDFGVDAIVHVGTHGNLEFLPGKGTGLSGKCYPDIAIGNIPHLYIYNADNPPEGTIAKRRSYATLVDHMQTVMTQGGLYEGLEELDRFLGEYEQLKDHDPGRAHALEHLIMDAIRQTRMDSEIKITMTDAEGKMKKRRLAELEDDQRQSAAFDEIAGAAHGALSRVRNTQIQDGLHIFGTLPEGERRIDFINAIMRYDAGQRVSLRKVVAAMMGTSLSALLEDSAAVNPEYRKSNGELLEIIDAYSKAFIRDFMNDGHDLHKTAKEIMGDDLKNAGPIDSLATLGERVHDLNHRIEQSMEIDSLLQGFEGGYIPAGPSGLITRGRDDILPTGRNFYSLDPHRVPTKAAWQVGRNLAAAVIDKHKTEEGRMPENVAIYWMCNDIMWADGEGMAQIFSLLGVRPVWQPNGRVKGFEIISLEELGRPRVDVTIRVSGITRDNFPHCVEMVDEAVQSVAALPEPEEMNFVRNHTLAQIKEAGEDEADRESFRNATLRVFASKPGTYQPGVNLAVYASAWKEEKDLSDIFVYWNGYAYGKGVFGKEKHRELARSLKTVDVTYNKVVTDEYDLFGCCCYFGTHGGMTAAARHISGNTVKTYYGDTREPEHVEVRDMADEVRRVVRTKLLNPRWIEGMKRHGYKGAGDISKRVGRVYGWEATTREVDDWIFDDIAGTFILDPENREFFEQNNPWALEEIGRRLLEAESRGLWEADPEVIEELKARYLEIEGWIEEKMGEVSGQFQGGAVDIMTAEDVGNWGEMMQAAREKLKDISQ